MAARRPGRDSFTFRLPTEVKEALRVIGEEQDRSISWMIEKACKDLIERHQAAHGEPLPRARQQAEVCAGVSRLRPPGGINPSAVLLSDGTACNSVTSRPRIIFRETHRGGLNGSGPPVTSAHHPHACARAKNYCEENTEKEPTDAGWPQ